MEEKRVADSLMTPSADVGNADYFKNPRYRLNESSLMIAAGLSLNPE